MKKTLIGATLGLLGLGAVAFAQGVTLPQVTTIGPNDLFQDIVNGQPQASNQYVSATLLGNYSGSLAGANSDSALIGGDFYQNTWARGTTSATITGTAAYGPSDWFLWSGTSTNLVATQQTAAADIPSNFLASARVTRSSTGVVQSCIAQEVESSVAERLQGQTAEFDFHALAGAGFSDATSSLHVYVITGTSTDEGSSKMAFSINAGGGGGSGWTGAAVIGGTPGLSVPITTSWGRYTVVAPIPATAKEVGVALCWTPVGASPTNDYFEFTGAQLVANGALSSVAGTAGGVIAPSDTRSKAFVRRNTATEVVNQERYVYAINEAAATAGSVFGAGGAYGSSTTLCSIAFPLPVTMRAAPTYANALTASTFKITSASQTATALGTPFSATLGANSANAASISFTTTGMTAKDFCELVSAGGTGSMVFTSEL
jgi:hypothetical protein